MKTALLICSYSPCFAQNIAMLAMIACLACHAKAAIWYVDGAATGKDNGSSWEDAWVSLDAMKGLSPGDTVYISGGRKGSSQVYPMSTAFTSLPGFAKGTRNKPVTYRIGKEFEHRGTAVFSKSPVGGHFLYAPSSIAFLGDAGDNEMHFEIRGFDTLLTGPHSSDVRVTHFNCGEINRLANLNPANGIELAYLQAKIIDPHANNAIYSHFKGGKWDENSIHHCTILIPNNGTGIGSDGIAGGGTGWSLHDNTIKGYYLEGSDGNHQDGWQGLAGSHIKIYNNTFIDITNYPIFGNAYYGDFSHLFIYNNIIIITNDKIQSSIPPQGIAVGPDGGVFRKLKRWPTFTHVVIANNLIVDYGRHASINLRNNRNQESVFVDCIVANNLYVNSGGIGLDPAVSHSSNVGLTSRQAAKVLRKYSPLATDNDLRLAEGALPALANGTNLISYFNVDKEGHPRPAEGAWTVGPYEARHRSDTISSRSP